MIEEDDLSNRARFNTLKEGVKSLFNKVVRDVDNARSARDHALIDDKLTRINRRYARALYALEQSAAQNTQEEAALSLIAEWAGAQALKVCPEIVDETDVEIESDVSRMLVSAEAMLEELQTGPLKVLLRINNEALMESQNLNKDQVEIYNALEAAEEVLEMYQDYI